MKKAMYGILLFLMLGGAFLLGSWSPQRAPVQNGPSAARKILYYVDPMHPAYKSDKPGIAPDCGMELVPVYEDGSMGGSGASASSTPPGTVNVSSEKQQLIGVQVATVTKTRASQTVRTVGRVTTDENRVHRLLMGIDGWIRDLVGGTTGSVVQKDQVLATMYNREFLTAEQALIYAVNARDRFKKERMDSPEQVTATNAQIQSAEDNLRALGMGDVQIQEIAETRKVTREIAIRAPVTAFVLSRNVFPGLRFERGTELYRLVDLGRIWILADLFEGEAQYFRPGTTARVAIPHQDKTFFARVSDVPPQFDPGTRTLKVRLEMDNPGLLLRPDMFVDVELPITLPSTIAIPVDALVDAGVKKTVFVDRGEGSFEPRAVETGWRHGDRVEIVKGLKPGERIVVSGTFLLDSESRMKAAASGATGHMHEGHTHAVEAATKGAMTAVARAFAPATDPICGMEVDIEKATAAGLTGEYQGNSYYFCSLDCREKFIKDPEHYLTPPAKSDGHHGSHQHGG